MKHIYIRELLEYLDKNKVDYEFIGKPNDTINGFSSITKYKEDTITWIKNTDILINNKITTLNIRLVVLNNSVNEFKKFKNAIVVNNPKNVFFMILEEFYSHKIKYGIGKNNIISKSAKIHSNIYIGNNCIIGDNVEIEEGTIILNNVVISENVKIGKYCTIKSGAIIGEIGFGYSANEKNESIRVPHFGGVIIGDNVDIGANTTIERGTIDDTIIKRGTKIDDLCQISHNVIIGENANIITHTCIFGSAKIGNNCYISTSLIRNQLVIGDNVIVGMGSVVVKNIEDNEVVYGNPASYKGKNEVKRQC